MTWDYLSWEATATFVAGVAAVVGAVFVWSRQAKILDRQNELKQLDLREALFDRRWPVYNAVRSWLDYIVMHARLPHADERAQLQGEIQQDGLSVELLRAIEISRFVFRPSVFEDLEEIWVWGNRLRYHQRMQTGQVEDLQPHLDGEEAALNWLENRRRELAAVFGDELRLSDGLAPTLRPLADEKQIIGALR